MTARAILDAPQVALLLERAGIEASEVSPLPRAASPGLDSAAAGALRAQGLLSDDGRANLVFLEVLGAAARPEEVLSFQVTGGGAPGFTLCRRGDVWTEATAAVDGTTKFAFPLNRTAMITAVTTALSGTSPEAAPIGFRFRGRSSDGLVLVAIASAGADGIPASVVDAHVRDYVATHTGAGIAAALGDPAGMRTLDEAGAAEAVARLEGAGHLVRTGTQLVASRRALAVLRSPASAGFTASRTTVDDAGARTLAVQVWRCGDRNLLTRPVTLPDGSGGVEWADYQRSELRVMVTAIYLAPGSVEPGALAAD